ncbi:MAG: RNase adapter RapZ [Thalassobaculales bacterium]
MTAPAILITGLSGAGRSTALKALEDAGHEAVDNLPLSLLPALLSGAGERAIAIGVDIRTRDFAVAGFLALLAELRQRQPIRLVFLDCAAEALERRFTETRRRHPLATDRPLAEGIGLEQQIMAPLREAADQVIDTTALTTAELKRRVTAEFGAGRAPGLAVSVVSFSFRRGLPRDADMVFDVRFLRNPHYDPALRPHDGRQPAVQAHIAADPDYQRFLGDLTRLIEPLLPRFEGEGKSYLTIAVGCTGGRHRSVFVAEMLAGWLAGRGVSVALIHRDVGVPGGESG